MRFATRAETQGFLEQHHSLCNVAHLLCSSLIVQCSSRVWLVLCEELFSLVGGFGPALQDEALPLGLPAPYHMPAQFEHGTI